MVAVSSSRGGLVRQNTFTKESRAPAAGAVRPATTQESAARLVTSAERESGRAVAVSAAAWAQDRVSLVGGRIVRRRSAGVAAAGAGPSQEPSGSGGEEEQRPKLVRRRTWTKEDGEMVFRTQQQEDYSVTVAKGERYETKKQGDNLKLEGQFQGKRKTTLLWPVEKDQQSTSTKTI